MMNRVLMHEKTALVLLKKSICQNGNGILQLPQKIEAKERGWRHTQHHIRYWFLPILQVIMYLKARIRVFCKAGRLDRGKTWTLIINTCQILHSFPVFPVLIRATSLIHLWIWNGLVQCSDRWEHINGSYSLLNYKWKLSTFLMNGWEAPTTDLFKILFFKAQKTSLPTAPL